VNNKPGSLRLLTLNNNRGSLLSTYLEQKPRLSEIYLPWTTTPVLSDLLTLNYTTTPVLWVLFTLNNYNGSLRLLTLNNNPGSLLSTYLEQQPRLSEIYLPWTTTQALYYLLT